MDRSYGLENGSTGPTIYKTGISDLQVLYFHDGSADILRILNW